MQGTLKRSYEYDLPGSAPVVLAVQTNELVFIWGG